MNTVATKYEDAIGAGMSIACAIHSLAAPFLVALVPVLYGESADLWMSLGLIALTGAILARGWVKHRHAGPPIVFAIGSLLLLGSHLTEVLPHELEHGVIVAVALFFVGAHVYNFKCSKKCCGTSGH